MALNPQQLEERYRRGMQNAGQNWQDGVRNTQKDWAARTKSSKQKAILGFQEAMNTNKYERGIDRRGTEGWRQRALDKASNFSSSVDRATTGYVDRIQDMIAVDAAVAPRVAALPSNTFEERLERMRQNAILRRDAWRTRNGG